MMCENTHIECVVEIKVVVTVEMAADEFIDLCLAGGVQILELVDGLKLDDIETIWQDAVRFPFQEMFALVGGDMRDSGEHVRAVRRRAFDAVSVVYPAFSCFVIDVKVLEVVVEIDGAGAEVPAEEGCMGGEDGGDVDVAFAAKWDGQSGLPFVEMRDNSGGELPCNVLWRYGR